MSTRLLDAGRSDLVASTLGLETHRRTRFFKNNFLLSKGWASLPKSFWFQFDVPLPTDLSHERIWSCWSTWEARPTMSSNVLKVLTGPSCLWSRLYSRHGAMMAGIMVKLFDSGAEFGHYVQMAPHRPASGQWTIVKHLKVICLSSDKKANNATWHGNRPPEPLPIRTCCSPLHLQVDCTASFPIPLISTVCVSRIAHVLRVHRAIP